MNWLHFRFYALLILPFLVVTLLATDAFSSTKTYSPISKKHLNQDSLSIDLLLTQIRNANSKERKEIFVQLRKFKVENYSKRHKEKIQRYLIAKPYPYVDLILLSGFLKMETTLLVLAKKHQNNKNLLQKINFALVRSGNFSKANTLRKNIEKLTVDDPFIYEVLPLLAYTKEVIIYDWLLDQINADEKNCHPADAEGAGNINCAYRIMEAIAPAINEFPIPLDQWGDLDSDSYFEALTTVRDWIATNQRDFTLNKQTY